MATNSSDILHGIRHPHDPSLAEVSHTSSSIFQHSQQWQWLREALDHAAHFLPGQAPLEVFVHHNTLHHYESLSFHEAVDSVQQKTGACGYLPEEAYRQAFDEGRINHDDIDEAIEHYAPKPLPQYTDPLPQTHQLLKLVLLHDISAETPQGVFWRINEHQDSLRFAEGVAPDKRQRLIDFSIRWLEQQLDTKGLRHLCSLLVGQQYDTKQQATVIEDLLGVDCTLVSLQQLLKQKPQVLALQALWQSCREISALLENTTPLPQPNIILPRDAAIVVGAEDPDDLVHPVLITLAASFLDRGQSHWSMPDRETGFFGSFCRILATGHAVRPSWLKNLGAQLRKWINRNFSAEQAVAELLDELGIDSANQEMFIENTLLRLPGWAGMFHRLETTNMPIGRSTAVVRLIDFLAVRLCLDVLALKEVGRRIGFDGTIANLIPFCRQLRPVVTPTLPGDHDRAWPLFLLAQHNGVTGEQIRNLGTEVARALLTLVKKMTPAVRSRLWHEAYEINYRNKILSAIQQANKSPKITTDKTQYQVVFCIDDRNESIRRHFERISEAHQTFGVAGFFNLAIAYQGLDDPSTFPLCPVVISPEHMISEEVHSTDIELAEKRKQRRKQLGHVSAHFGQASRSMILGPLITAFAGILSALPLLASVFTPWFAGKVRKKITHWLLPLPKTRLSLPSAAPSSPGELHTGFSVEEKTNRVATLLENIALTKSFGKLVVILGHDSSSVNNPHFAAYSCGACGGRSGGPNARLFARMANRPEVREGLKKRGIEIPDSTWFVGGVHDTCSDRISLLDLDDVPDSHKEHIDSLRKALDTACQHNAQERSRKFESAPAKPNPRRAHRHVEERSFDLSQARPELGHATNASCVVGRRSLTENIFLDRRAFLVSYNPQDDPDGMILERILLAVGPVGSGINLEYLFSTTDNEKFGAGTKLPHNVTGLFGVMNGASSDLRTGLPKQMIEIHEPIRLQLVVESDCDTVKAIMVRQPKLANLFLKEWVKLLIFDYKTHDVFIARPSGVFELWQPPSSTATPEVKTWSDWYSGKLGFVPPAIFSTNQSTTDSTANLGNQRVD